MDCQTVLFCLSFPHTPYYVSDNTKVMSHFSAGMEWMDRHVRLVSKWQLQRAAMPNRIIWEPILGLGCDCGTGLGLFLIFQMAVISYQMTGLIGIPSGGWKNGQL